MTKLKKTVFGSDLMLQKNSYKAVLKNKIYLYFVNVILKQLKTYMKTIEKNSRFWYTCLNVIKEL